MFQLQERFGVEKKQYLILKIKEKFIKLKLLKAFRKEMMFQFIFMETGMICAEGLTYPQQEKLENMLNLQKYQELIGEVTQTMKCYKGFMEQAGHHKKT